MCKHCKGKGKGKVIDAKNVKFKSIEDLAEFLAFLEGVDAILNEEDEKEKNMSCEEKLERAMKQIAELEDQVKAQVAYIDALEDENYEYYSSLKTIGGVYNSLEIDEEAEDF